MDNNILNVQSVKVESKRVKRITIKSNLLPEGADEFRLDSITHQVEVEKMVQRSLMVFFQSVEASVVLNLSILYYRQTGAKLNSFADNYYVPARNYSLLCFLYKKVLREVAFDCNLEHYIKFPSDNDLDLTPLCQEVVHMSSEIKSKKANHK